MDEYKPADEDFFRDTETGEEWLSYSPVPGAWFRFVILKEKAPDFLKFFDACPDVKDALSVIADYYCIYTATSHK